jgi:hypothetical protein
MLGNAVLYGWLLSNFAANIFYSLYINGLCGFSRGEDWMAVAKSLQREAKKKAYEDQSLAQRRLARGVAISFRCSAFSTDKGRFWREISTQTQNPVGASLLAIAVWQSTLMSTDPAPSRASSLVWLSVNGGIVFQQKPQGLLGIPYLRSR